MNIYYWVHRVKLSRIFYNMMVNTRGIWCYEKLEKQKALKGDNSQRYKSNIKILPAKKILNDVLYNMSFMWISLTTLQISHKRSKETLPSLHYSAGETMTNTKGTASQISTARSLNIIHVSCMPNPLLLKLHTWVSCFKPCRHYSHTSILSI